MLQHVCPVMGASSGCLLVSEAVEDAACAASHPAPSRSSVPAAATAWHALMADGLFKKGSF